ncbi:MAG: hypothetical protein BGO09_14805 [Bacteroidetes bacterium 47-18]|nr:MAG: hypothetical protein BGO09_14805 [Bacteroidetes bacterium 47-18]
MLVRIISVSATLFLTYFLSHKLSVAQFGTITSFWVQTVMAVTIAGLGLPVFVFTYSRQKLGQLLAALPQAYKLYFGGWIGVASAVFAGIQLSSNTLFAPDIASFFCLALFFAVTTMGLLLDALSIIYGYYQRLIFAAVCYNAWYIILYVLYYRGTIGPDLLLAALTGNAILKVILLSRQVFKAHQPAGDISFLSLKSHWLSTGLYDVSQNVVKYLDKFILSFLVGKEALAAYTNLTTEIPVFALVFASVKSSTSIYLAHSARNERHIGRYLRAAGRLLGYFIFPSVFFIGMFAPDIITMVFSEKYLGGIALFLVALLKLPNYNFMFSAVLQYYEKGHIVHKGVWVDTLVSLVLVFPLYYCMGLSGIVLSMVISTYCQNFYYGNALRKIMNTSWTAILPLRSWMIQAGVFAGLSAGLWYILNQTDLHYMARLSIAFAVMAPLSLWGIYRTYRQIKRF